MSKFIQQVGNPPIHSNFNSTGDDTDSANDITLTGKTNSEWQKWLGQVKDQLNNNNYYGYPSVLLNSDFYWNKAIATPVTQADPDGTYFSEKWQVHGSAVATYTLTQTAFPANNSDQIGSITYIRVQVSAYTAGDFYLYQRQTGSEFLRRYQNRSISFSILANNTTTNTLKVQLEIFIFFDPTSVIKKQAVIFLDPGETETASIIKTEPIAPTAVGAGAYVEFRLRFISLEGNPADFNLIYLKAEMADQATVLYVDHALERTRIDNS